MTGGLPARLDRVVIPSVRKAAHLARSRAVRVPSTPLALRRAVLPALAVPAVLVDVLASGSAPALALPDQAGSERVPADLAPAVRRHRRVRLRVRNARLPAEAAAVADSSTPRPKKVR